MLTAKLLSFTLLGAEWVLWTLIFLSVLSVALMIERLIYFLTHRLAGAESIALSIMKGDVANVKKQVATASGIQAAVVREGLANVELSPEAVEEIIGAVVAREKKHYERGLAFLGTLGNNAPFVGLFGTVLGIIRAFHDLAVTNSTNAAKAAAGAATVMAGISEALVATAVGLFVAIPAVVAFNSFNRWLKSLNASSTELGHAVVAYLRTAPAAEKSKQQQQVA
jgi:biopolymer transport protein ExbB